MEELIVRCNYINIGDVCVKLYKRYCRQATAKDILKYMYVAVENKKRDEVIKLASPKQI